MNTLICGTKTEITPKLITFTKHFVKIVHVLLYSNPNTTYFTHAIWIRLQQ